MDRKCYGFEVYETNGGNIAIKQEDHEESIVIFCPEQIDQLCQWLKEAAEESLGSSTDDVVKVG